MSTMWAGGCLDHHRRQAESCTLLPEATSTAAVDSSCELRQNDAASVGLYTAETGLPHLCWRGFGNCGPSCKS